MLSFFRSAKIAKKENDKSIGNSIELSNEQLQAIHVSYYRNVLRKYPWPLRNFLLTNIVAKIRKDGCFDVPIVYRYNSNTDDKFM